MRLFLALARRPSPPPSPTPIPHLRQLLSSCPACWNNFIGFFCQFTCSPNQSQFLDVVRVKNTTAFGLEVAAVNALVSQEFADGFYDSCSDVTFGQANFKTINFLANGTGVCAVVWIHVWLTFTLLSIFLHPLLISFSLYASVTHFHHPTPPSPHQNGFGMLRYLGYQQDPNPISIQFPWPNVTAPMGMNRLPFTPYACDDPDPRIRCSCVDCAKTCPVNLPSIPDRTCYVGNTDWQCMAFSLVVTYAVVTVLALAFFGGRFLIGHWKRKQQNIFLDQEEATTLESDPLLEDNTEFSPERPVHFHWPVDVFFQRFFYRVGRICANRPKSVVALSILTVAVLSIGWTKFRVETNPVNLWVDPSSQTLAEKNYFDDKFAPFYRVTQLIITRKNQSDTIMDFGFLSETWDLYEEIEKMVVSVGGTSDVSAGSASDDSATSTSDVSAGSTNDITAIPTDDITTIPTTNVTVKDLCFSVAGVCANQAFLNWYKFQKSIFMQDKSLSRFRNCARASGDRNCFKLQPSLANVVLGGVTNAKLGNPADSEANPNWNEAKSVVFTFVLNNEIKNSTQQRMAIAWERTVVDNLLGREFENMTVAFSTEVCFCGVFLDGFFMTSFLCSDALSCLDL